MSICGGIPATADVRAELERSLSALCRGPRSATRRWTGASAGLAACDDGGLFADTDGTAVVDGRIDNRAELLGELGLGPSAGLSDAELLLHLYRKSGAAFSDRVLGDFSCAVWDARERTLLLASDPGALRPMFYWLGPDEILFASEQRGLWCHPRVPKQLDEDQMAAWLARLPREPSRSFYRDICRVPPGHRVVWRDNRVTIDRYWRPEDLPTLWLKRDEDYAEALHDLLDQAVRCRIGTQGPVATQLSGGLDSSSVTALAARALAEQDRPLIALTMAPTGEVGDLGPGRFADESSHAAAVARGHANIEHVLIPNFPEPFLDALDRREAVQDWPVLSVFGVPGVDHMARTAAHRGCKVMLTGNLGNMTASYDGLTLLPALARRMHWRRLAQSMAQMRARSGHRWSSILAMTLLPLLPLPAARAVRQRFGRPELALPDYSLINPAFLKRSGLEARAVRHGGSLGNLVDWDGRRLRLAVFDRSDHRGHMAAALRRQFGVDMLDPTSDRRVVEFCLAIPEEQFLHQGEPRALIRRAMAPLLPPEILQERRRGLQMADWHGVATAARWELAAEVARLEQSPLAQQCLDLPRLRRLIDDWPAAHDMRADNYLLYQFALPFTLSAGRFIRRLEGGNM